jgi:hypothetical protein
MKSGFIKFEESLREFIRGGSSQEFQTLALELFSLQFAHNPGYRRFCEAENCTPERVRNWNEIPAVPTVAFKDFELTSIPAGQRTTVFCSSGTIPRLREPSRHFHNASSLALYELSLIEWGKRHLPLGNGSIIFLTPPASLAPHSSLVHMFETLQRTESIGHSTFVGQIESPHAWSVNVARVVSLLTVCTNSNESVGVLGTAFNFVHLLDALRERKLSFRLSAGSWVLETGGYKGRSRSLPKAELHGLISEFLGIPRGRIICEYGMSELSSQAYDFNFTRTSSGERAFQFPRWARAQIVSPENGREVSDGDTGLLRVFDLANVYSVMAIATEDLAVRRGSGFELIGRARHAEPRGCSLMTV